MALSMYESIMAANGGHRPTREQFARIMATGGRGRPGGMGALGSAAGRAGAMAAAAAAEVEPKLASVANVAARVSASLAQLKSQASQVTNSARTSTDPGIFPVIQQLNDAVMVVEESATAAIEANDQLDSLVSGAKSRDPVGWAMNNQAQILALIATVDAAAKKATRSISAANTSIMQAQQQLQQVQQAAAQTTTTTQSAWAQELERLKFQAEQAQKEREWQAQQAAAQQQRADAAAQAQAQYQLQLAQQQGSGAAAQQEFQQQLILLEQQRLDAELQFKREQVERENARRDQQDANDAMLQQLLFMQQMGMNPAQAMPGMVAPGGMPTMPGIPGAFTQGPAQAWQQSYGIAPAQQAQGSGFEFATFNPSGEMFGLGADGMPGRRMVMASPFPGRNPYAMRGLGAADMPVGNATLRGGLIEQGYNVHGPSADAQNRPYYTFEAPDGFTWTVWGTQVIGAQSFPQKDPRSGRVIYAPPTGGMAVEEKTDWNAVQNMFSNLVGTGVNTYGAVSQIRQGEKLADAQRRGYMPTAMGPVDGGSGFSLSNWIAPVAGLGAGAVVLSMLLGGRKKK